MRDRRILVLITERYLRQPLLDGAIPMADKLKTIKADTPEDFMDEATAAIGAGDALGVTTFDLSGTKWKTQGGKVVKGELKVSTEVTRAHWGGPTKNNEKALKDIDTWIQQHENKHVKLANDIVAKAKKSFEKDIVGKTDAEAQKLLDKIEKDIKDAYADLDSKEGKLTATKGSSGVYTLKPGPA
jgi:hypothetical protein